MTSESQQETEQEEMLKNFTKTVGIYIKSEILLKKKQILEKRRKENHKINTCLMDMLIEIGENTPAFTDEDIIGETSTFMLAGQDSVGAALVFSLYFLAKHQHIQTKVIKEINEISDKNAEKWEDIAEMRYLEQCIKESMRLCPSVPLLTRELKEKVCFGGKAGPEITLPVGATVFISPLVTHRLPHVFSEPEKFDPDRFSQENLKSMHPFAYLPFSAGPRNCIGGINNVLQTLFDRVLSFRLQIRTDRIKNSYFSNPEVLSHNPISWT